MRAVAVLVALLVALPEAASADIWSYTDSDGVVHYTNIPPRRSQHWKKVMVEQPARGTKAAARRGSCPHCDVVPATDNSPERYHRYDAYIAEASQLYHIPVALIRAVMKTESDYDPHVVSSAGAQGLMQVMPSVEIDMHGHDPFDPRDNILTGTRELRTYANRYDGDIVLTIAAYHAGPGSLKKYGDQVPPYPLTRQYLKMVLDRYYKYKAEEQAGASLLK